MFSTLVDTTRCWLLQWCDVKLICPRVTKYHTIALLQSQHGTRVWLPTLVNKDLAVALATWDVYATDSSVNSALYWIMRTMSPLNFSCTCTEPVRETDRKATKQCNFSSSTYTHKHVEVAEKVMFYRVFVWCSVCYELHVKSTERIFMKILPEINVKNKVYKKRL